VGGLPSPLPDWIVDAPPPPHLPSIADAKERSGLLFFFLYWVNWPWPKAVGSRKAGRVRALGSWPNSTRAARPLAATDDETGAQLRFVVENFVVATPLAPLATT